MLRFGIQQLQPFTHPLCLSVPATEVRAHDGHDIQTGLAD